MSSTNEQVAPEPEARCVAHCGHPLSFVHDGQCIFQYEDERLCGHRCVPETCVNCKEEIYKPALIWRHKNTDSEKCDKSLVATPTSAGTQTRSYTDGLHDALIVISDYWECHIEFKTRASGHPVTEIEEQIAELYNRASFPARNNQVTAAPQPDPDPPIELANPQAVDGETEPAEAYPAFLPIGSAVNSIPAELRGAPDVQCDHCKNWVLQDTVKYQGGVTFCTPCQNEFLDWVAGQIHVGNIVSFGGFCSECGRAGMLTSEGVCTHHAPQQDKPTDSAVPPERNGLNRAEPAPTTNNERPVWELVIEDMQSRDSAGAAKYGTRLQPHNGRNALVDAYQEALDLVVYLRQEIAESTTRSPAPTAEQVPLTGEWRYGNGYLMCGTLRIMRADFDTNPSLEFINDLTQFIIARLNDSPPPASVVGEGPGKVNTGTPPDEIWVHPWRELLYSPAFVPDYVKYVRDRPVSPPTSVVAKQREPSFTISQIRAVVGNKQLDNSLWVDDQDKAVACLRSRIIAAFEYAAEGKDYRGTLDELNRVTKENY